MAAMLDIDEAWENFCDGDYDIKVNRPQPVVTTEEMPKSSPIYISTKTKISYLDRKIDLHKVFWEIPIVPYHFPKTGVVKKQMKFNSASQEELDIMQTKLPKDIHTDEHIISRIVKPEGRIKFRDVRKISIGLCKKDITSYRCKKKQAFYNCFALILRIKIDGCFKEIHVKVFNTGKLEIPGIQTDEVLWSTLDLLTKIIGPYVDGEKPLTWLRNKSETVLINSNFTCGYFVNREKLYNRLKFHYKINSAYDPCSYPGIQCEFYYNKKNIDGPQNGQQPTGDEKKNYVKISFMIFRTGSVLIVGKCTEFMLNNIYTFLKDLLEKEYVNVGGKIITEDIDKKTTKIKKIRKKTIIIS